MPTLTPWEQLVGLCGGDESLAAWILKLADECREALDVEQVGYLGYGEVE